MEDQVTSLKISKQLKEAGFEVDTPFAWMISVSGKDMVDAPITKRGHQLPCYTFQPLWEALPEIIEDGAIRYNKMLIDDTMLYSGIYFGFNGYEKQPIYKNTTMIDKLAEAVLWGIKEGYINLDEKK